MNSLLEVQRFIINYCFSRLSYFFHSTHFMVLRLYNRTTRELIQPRCVLTWARTLLANRKAVDGPSWVKWFSPFNSGTINNQWNLDLSNVTLVVCLRYVGYLKYNPVMRINHEIRIRKAVLFSWLYKVGESIADCYIDGVTCKSLKKMAKYKWGSSEL